MFNMITPAEVELLHSRIQARYGGAPGVRDRNLIEGALGRAEMLLIYSDLQTDHLEKVVRACVAAAAGTCRSHPFTDSNKRVSLIVLFILLRLNGVNFRPRPDSVADAMVALSARAWTEEEFGNWVLSSSTLCDQHSREN
jgi:death-on-curing protein